MSLSKTLSSSDRVRLHYLISVPIFLPFVAYTLHFLGWVSITPTFCRSRLPSRVNRLQRPNSRYPFSPSSGQACQGSGCIEATLIEGIFPAVKPVLAGRWRQSRLWHVGATNEGIALLPRIVIEWRRVVDLSRSLTSADVSGTLVQIRAG